MSSRFVVPGVLMLAIAQLSTAAPASADAWIPLPGEYYSEFRGTHQAWSGFYDDSGEKRDFVFGILQEDREIRSHNELGWRRGMSFLFALPLRSSSLRSDLPGFDDTQTALTDLLVGTHVKLLDGSTAASIQVDWQIPMGYEASNLASVGDGLHHVAGRLDFGMSFEPLQSFFQGSAGYRARYDVRLNPSKATHHVGPDFLDYGADLAFWLGSSVLVSARHSGFTSINEGQNDFEMNGQAVGPELRYRVDDRMDVFAGAAFFIAGRNVDFGNTYYLGLGLKHTQRDRLQGFIGGTRRP